MRAFQFIRRAVAAGALLGIAHLVASGCGITPTRVVWPTSNSQRVEVPFKLHNGFFIFPVTLSTGTWWMTLDASQPGFFLDNRAAGQTVLPPPNETVTIQQSPIIGGVQFHGLTAYVDPSISEFDHIDGVVGIRAFDDILLTIDGPGRRLIMEHGQLPPADGQEVLAMQTDAIGRPSVTVQMGGRDERAGLDTFALEDVRLIRFRAPDFPGMAHAVRDDSLYFMGNPFNGEVARLDGDLTIGRYHVHRPIVNLIDGSHTDVALGYGLLQYFVVTIDLKHRLVRFHLPGAAPPERRTIDLGFRAERKTGEVTEVRPDGPTAAAGMRYDDRILKMNGYVWSAIAQNLVPVNALVPPSLQVPLQLRSGDGTQRQIVIHAVNPLP